jgi:cyclic pyranopterin phosphate synthase
MPREHFDANFRFLPRSELLSFEEIARVSRVFATLGVRKLRLTGGEPLLRKDLWELVKLLRRIPDVELALTTNGALLAEQAARLRAAGLDRVTVSLDSLDEQVFRAMNDTPVSPERVLQGIAAAEAAGLRPLKINMVVKKGVNDHEVVSLARHFRGTGHVLRFIEYMDVGVTNGWDLRDVVSGREILARIDAQFPLEPLSPEPAEDPARTPAAPQTQGVARRYRYRDGAGEIGIIASVTEPFCGTCSRARVSAEGRLFTCLFSSEGTDLRDPLRSDADDATLATRIQGIWRARDDRYSELRGDGKRRLPRVEMSYIGG